MSGDKSFEEEIEETLARMTTYTPKSVTEEPDAVLQNFRVFRLVGGGCHFAGYNTVTRDGRVSSPVMSYDKDTRIGITRSGRRYKLEGTPSHFDDDAMYVWGVWCRKYGIPKDGYTDITDEFLEKGMYE